MWSQILLPIAATLLYPAITILNGKELFYKTAIPVWMMVLYAGLWVSDNVSGRMMIWLFWIALLFFAYLYTDITCGRIPAVLLLMRKCYMASERRLLIMAAVFFISSNLTLFPVWKTNIISLFIKQ